MKTLCKLTDKDGQTYNNTQWGEGITHTANGEGELCRSGWIHYYSSPLLAVLLNPIHGNFQTPILWKISVTGVIKENAGLKYGATSVTTIRKIPIPVVTNVQKVAFAILCSLEVYAGVEFVKWANNWLENKDRTGTAAARAAEEAEEAAVRAAEAAEEAAEEAAAWAAARTARAAARTGAAARTARAAEEAARAAAWTAVRAAEAAEEAAEEAAVRAAEAAEEAAEEAAAWAARASSFNLIAIAQKAMKYK